ncbi:hypothetical protein MMC13_002050 [Lambiella insularis]|nr:hypothetical protein [Lambiella insularis]
MKPPYPALVSEWHNAPYPAINPSSPALSHAGQTVVVTGAGSGIGQAACLAYAAADAARLVLIGRRESKLEETKAKLKEQSPKCAVEVHAADATKANELKNVATKVAGWDVLVLNAGRIVEPKSIEDSDPDSWWDVVETNMRGFFASLHSFLPSRKPGARIIGVSAAIVNLPSVYPPCHGASAYVTSKLAQIRLLEHVAAECPDVFVVAIHPGIVETDLLLESAMVDANAEGAFLDDVNLPAHFFVWATTKDAAFLRGKFCYANWDVEQLKARAKEIQETPILTPNILGWPFEAKP